MPSLTGSSLCHRVSLTIIDPVPVMDAGLEICRCTDCRQFTGATAGFLLDAETANVSIKGQEDIKSFQSKSDAGNTLTRHWCGNCGSSLYDTTSMREGKRMVIHGGKSEENTRRSEEKRWANAQRSLPDWVAAEASGADIHALGREMGPTA